MDMYKGHLSSPGSIRDMAALLLGRLLTRPDLQPALDNFLQWSRTALHSEGSQAHFLIPGADGRQPSYGILVFASDAPRKARQSVHYGPQVGLANCCACCNVLLLSS